MKLQCSCGAKYGFELTPAMATNPVRFICPACGLDASEFVDSLVRRELGQSGPPAGVPQPIIVSAPAAPASPPMAQAIPSPVAQPPRPAIAVRVHSPQAAPAPAAPVAAVRVHTPQATPVQAVPAAAQATPDLSGPQACQRHPTEAVTDKCYICSKPICPKCLELFGYLCSPLCKSKADSHGIKVPVYAGQKSLVQARFWRKVTWISSAAAAGVVALVGVWIWYAWFGCLPKPAFSIRFQDPSYSGQSFFAGQDQIVFLHGATLARHDMKQNKQIWSRELLDFKQIEAQAAKRLQKWDDDYGQWEWEDSMGRPVKPTLEQLARHMFKQAAAQLELRVHGQNVWVASHEKLARYDWDTGNPAKELLLKPGWGGLISRGDKMLVVETSPGKAKVTQVNLANGEVQVQGVGSAASSALLAGSFSRMATNAAGRSAKTGLPLGAPGSNSDKPMDPAKVAEQVQRMPLPNRLALPAVLANTRAQERALAEMKDEEGTKTAAPAPKVIEENLSLVPTRDGYVQFAVGLLERRIVERDALKAPPAKRAVDGDTSLATADNVLNEMLNEMQLERGGGKLRENLSRYLVTLRRPDGTEIWAGEVVGYPNLFPLQTLSVITANKRILVFDKDYKKLWESSLTYNVSGDLDSLDSENAPYGQGPLVERKDTLYVIDQGVLTAFDLANGNARWRVPSVGITGLFFDEKDMLYVNTTTAPHDRLKLPMAIDVTQKTSSLVLKLDPKDGSTLWSMEPGYGGLVNYVGGKFIYSVLFYMPEESDNPYRGETSSGKPPYLRIRRISPKDGHILWEHFQQRAPLDIQFDKNIIRLVFKKEVQVLKCLTF